MAVPTPVLPAMKPSAGVVPDFVFHHHESRVNDLVATSIALPVVAAVFLGLRMWTRIAVIHAVGIDDYLLIFAMILAIVFSALMITTTRCGLGVHQYDVPFATFFPRCTHLIWSAVVITTVVPFFVKLSLLVLYLRLFSSSKTGRVVIWFAISFISLFTASNLLFNLVICRPLARAWDPTVKGGRCVDASATQPLVGNIMTAVTDLMVLVIPIPLVTSLQLGRRQKLALLAILLIGATATVISFVRLCVYILDTRGNIDLAWALVPISKWFVIETNLGIICACLIVLKPLVRQLFPTWSESFHRSSVYLNRRSGGPPSSQKKWFGSSSKPQTGPSDAISLTGTRFGENEYLELGKRGTTSTSIGKASPMRPWDDQIIGNLDVESGGIVKTVDMDVVGTDSKSDATSRDLAATRHQPAA